MRMSRCAVGLLLALAAGLGAAPQDRPLPGAPSRPAVEPPPLPTGPAPDLNLVFTGEVVGYVEPCG